MLYQFPKFELLMFKNLQDLERNYWLVLTLEHKVLVALGIELG